MKKKIGPDLKNACYRLKLRPVILILVYAFLILFCSDSFSAETGSYKVDIQGLSDKNLLSQIRQLSKSLEMSSKPAGSLTVLEKRVREDIDIITRYLKSEGYFDARINEIIDTDSKPWNVIFNISCNIPFVISTVNIRLIPENNDNIKVPKISKTGMILSERYRSKAVLEGEEKLLFLIKKQGFPHPVVTKREITADHKAGSVEIDFEINPGRKAFFGDTELTGLKEVKHDFIMRFIPWKKGEVYDPDLLNRCYSDLRDLGLFSMIKITEGEELEENYLPVEVKVNERKHNSLGVGLNYYTDEGPGIKISWENRNLFGNGEKLGFVFNLANYLKTAESLFKKPGFFISEQTLHFSVKASREDPDAYTSDSYSGSAFIDRELTEKIDIGGGLTFKSSKIAQLESTESFTLLSMPLQFNLDYSDDLLDPKRGGRLTMKLIPYYDPSGESLFYNKGIINYRQYLKIADSPGIIMAGSLTAGTINGAGRIEVPADERFYSGGGGSVRGYPYQSVGPVSGTTPLGGKALFETSIEARFRMTRKTGFVLFLDGGTVFSEKLFDRSENIRWGTGVGFRYFTPIGPLRIDAGVPLNKRDGIDDSFQLYISIGQAF